MNRALFFLLLLVLLSGSAVAIKGDQSSGIRRLQDDDEDEVTGGAKEPKKPKEPKEHKKKEPKCKKEKKKKAPKDADETGEAPAKAEKAPKEEKELPYCEDLGTCEQIGAGVTPESKDKANGKISLRVAHSDDESGLVYKVTDILQYNTSAKLAGCIESPDDSGLEGPNGDGLVVSRAEYGEGYKLLGANFTNAKVTKSKEKCKKKNTDSCDTVTTDVKISYESLDGKSATAEEKGRMLDLLRQVVEEQEDAGVFDTIAASVEVVETDADGLTGAGSGTTTRSVGHTVLATVAFAALLQIVGLPL